MAMQVIEWSHFLEDALPFGDSRTAITIGVFDGVHKGHKALIERIVAFNDHAIPVVITFKHSAFKKERKEHLGEISSFRQKMAAFESLGVSVCITIEFSESFRLMSGKDFLRILYEQGKMSFLAVGSNFRCGYQLDTDAASIQMLNEERNIPTAIVEVLTEDSVTISSTQIRTAIRNGNLKTAEAMLGYPFTIDLTGVSPLVVDGGLAYGISDHGRILPPPGRYPGFLNKIRDFRGIKETTEILVEKGYLIIKGNPTDACLESVEFLT